MRGTAAARRGPAIDDLRPGFTLVEILVAIGVAAILFGICTALFVKVSKYKSRSEKLLFMSQEANGVLGRISRDVNGLYVGGPDLDDYWTVDSPADCIGERLTLQAAVENPGQADYCTISYYVKGTAEVANGKTWIRDGKLYRKLSGGAAPSSGAWSDLDADWLQAEGVIGLSFSIVPSDFAISGNGKMPGSVTVALKMADPDGQARLDGSQAYLVFYRTILPGSEENRP